MINSKNKINEDTLNEIKRLKAKKVIITGREGAIDKYVDSQLLSLGIEIQRIGGEDRYSTSVEIAKVVGVKNEVALATGLNYADALSFASIAANKNIPILLVNNNNIPQEVLKFLDETNPKKIYVIGGQAVISDNAIKDLKNVERISGKDRYSTNTEIMKYFSADIKKMLFLHQ
ncbi:cell wall-binding repeat-containing protein [Caloramator sp. mosi_1]|uniref:cell wall-binding repeat-containing protein n=1 Tax=Caloramator sp. mosi_1 TaxID=3023090 RepID=UPI003FCD583A